MSIAQPQRILIIKLRHHGDVLLTTPVVDAIKHHYPDCEVDILVYRETADVILDNHQLSNIFMVDRAWKKQGLKAQVKNELDLFKQLRARDYDWAFNLSDQWRTAAIAKLCAKCSASLAYEKRDNLGWQICHDFLNVELGVKRHMVENHLNVLPPLIYPESYQAKVQMDITESSRQKMLEKLRQQGWQGEDYVLMHPGSRWQFKCWDDEKYVALLQRLLDRGEHIVLTAAPDAVEQAMLTRIQERLNISNEQKIWSLSGCLNLRELAAAIEQSKLFIGVDSVPMHIAAALNKPQVALFGPSWLEKWRPYSHQASVVWAGDFGALPHPDKINTDDKIRLLSAIPVDAVWEKVVEKLKVN